MYKKIIAYATAIAIIISGIAFVPSNIEKTMADVADPTDSEWQLQWSDEFNGDALDTNNWSYEIGTGQNGWGNGEVQYYTNRTDNVAVSGGYLQIKAQRENYNGSQFTSGRIKTQGKKYFKYGKMEAKLRVEGGNQSGVWPAFWMMGNDISDVGWPACGELDIMEHANDRNYTEGTLHWGPSWNAHSSWGSYNDGKYNYFSNNQTNGITAWHTYGVTWDDSYIKWYMDDKVFLVASIGTGFDSHDYFTKDAFFLLNLALGGTGTGYTGGQTPDANFQNATMYVDYVRAYSYGSSGETTTQQTTTTKQSGELVADTDVPVNSWGAFGNYLVYTGTWDGINTAKAGVDPSDPSHIIVNKTNDVYNSAWLTQVKIEFPGLNPDEEYTYEWPIKATNSYGTVCSSDGNEGDNNQTPLNGGNQTLTGKTEISNDVVCAVVGMGWVNPSNPIEFFKPTVKDRNGNVVYPEQVTTTSKPTTTPVSTTVTPTTTAKSTTTKAPTQSPTTSKNKATLGKSKVKKAKKKMSAKKINVKLKKVKGASGYYVIVTKKKKSKKILAKKKVRKLKFKIKSKKLRNKKKLYVKARAFTVKNGVPSYGAWSKPKKVKIKR